LNKDVQPTDPYRLIEETAARWRRQRLRDACWPALPPALALLAAGWLGVLPVELAAAGIVAFGLLGVHLKGIELSPASAARFLDGALRAKDRFLTLATARPDESLIPVVAAEAATLAAAPLQMPPRNRRPLLTSFVLSILAFLMLYSLPQLPSLAATEGSDLERIAGELAKAGDASLASTLRDVARALRDSGRSNEAKLEKIAEALQKIEQTERKGGQGNAGGSAGGGEGNRGQGKQEASGEKDKGQGAGDRSSGGSSQDGAGDPGAAREQAKQELGKLAGQLSTESGQAKGRQQSQEKPNAQSTGGGIKGPESDAHERKQSERDGTANQPGKSPNASGGNERSGGNQGAAQAQRGEQDRQQGQSGSASQGGAGAGTDGSGQRSTPQNDTKPAERFYKPGEGTDGRIVDGQYVRVRVPDEDGQLPGTEIVAKPGDATPLTPYGNAPLPPTGAPGEVAADQPVPLEYRPALKGRSP
jgi:hypothetical protein